MSEGAFPAIEQPREVTWTAWNGNGMERLRLQPTPEGVRVEATIEGTDEGGRRFGARYLVEADGRWRTRRVRVELDGGEARMELIGTGAGGWSDAAGRPLPALAGAIDVDISATPFTNTLAIRRLGLRPGAKAALVVVYLSVPDMTARPEHQRYTCLERGPRGGRFLYEGPIRNFSAELDVDADGIVTDYPDFFRRSA